MESISHAVILGIVEGLTEFLPISSTGHLILTNALLGLSGEKIAAFDVVIQLGAILAVVVLYRRRFLGLLHYDPERPFSGARGLWLLFLTSLPAALLGLFADDFIERELFNPLTVAGALFVGAVLIMLVEHLRKRGPEPVVTTLDGLRPMLALGIGFFQCLALWPGFSRSASTIMGGMILGASRTVAAEYSFIAAVPIMIAATGYKLLSTWHLFEPSDFVFLGVGFVVSFLAAWAAVKGFIVLLGKTTLRPFAYYRFVLALVVAWIFRDEIMRLTGIAGA